MAKDWSIVVGLETTLPRITYIIRVGGMNVFNKVIKFLIHTHISVLWLQKTV